LSQLLSFQCFRLGHNCKRLQLRQSTVLTKHMLTLYWRKLEAKMYFKLHHVFQIVIFLNPFQIGR